MVDPSPQQGAPVPVGRHCSRCRRQNTALAGNRACQERLKADRTRLGMWLSG